MQKDGSDRFKLAERAAFAFQMALNDDDDLSDNE
jgi:hypothetical protein